MATTQASTRQRNVNHPYAGVPFLGACCLALLSRDEVGGKGRTASSQHWREMQRGHIRHEPSQPMKLTVMQAAAHSKLAHARMRACKDPCTAAQTEQKQAAWQEVVRCEIHSNTPARNLDQPLNHGIGWNGGTGCLFCLHGGCESQRHWVYARCCRSFCELLVSVSCFWLVKPCHKLPGRTLAQIYASAAAPHKRAGERQCRQEIGLTCARGAV